MKHTTGPWKFNMTGCLTSHGLPTINKSNGHLLASLADTNEANARLIAAAPDLLAALQLIQRGCGVKFEDAALRGLVIDAITKATGAAA